MKNWSDKRSSQIFHLRLAYFIVDALKNSQKPLDFLKKRQFLKKRDPKIFSPGAGIFQKIVRTKEGGQKHTLPSPRQRMFPPSNFKKDRKSLVTFYMSFVPNFLDRKFLEQCVNRLWN